MKSSAQMGHLYQTSSSQGSGTVKKKGQKVIKARGLRWPDQEYVLDMTEALYLWTLGNYAGLHKTHTISMQSTF